MVRAVREALDAPQLVVCAPVSGFHHAHYAHAEGYCTFNGLLVAVAAARLMGPVDNVLIIDGDGHYGNGTDDILHRLAIKGITNLTHWGLDATLRSLTWHSQITEALSKHKWDLVLYQAGADAHMDDPYGEGYLNDDEWELRDRLVFSLCHARGLPLVFNLAGGYNVKDGKTLALHLQTVDTARAIYRLPAQVRHAHVGE
jgi:acetoin utilization deacetylase AcuC-like enzyme